MIGIKHYRFPEMNNRIWYVSDEKYGGRPLFRRGCGTWLSMGAPCTYASDSLIACDGEMEMLVRPEDLLYEVKF